MMKFWTTGIGQAYHEKYPVPFGYCKTKEEADASTEAIGGDYKTEGFVIMTIEEFEQERKAAYKAGVEATTMTFYDEWFEEWLADQEPK